MQKILPQKLSLQRILAKQDIMINVSCLLFFNIEKKMILHANLITFSLLLYDLEKAKFKFLVVNISNILLSKIIMTQNVYVIMAILKQKITINKDQEVIYQNNDCVGVMGSFYSFSLNFLVFSTHSTTNSYLIIKFKVIWPFDKLFTIICLLF